MLVEEQITALPRSFCQRNLFNGGSDKAKAQEAADQINIAKDFRDKTCRDIRQTLSIAFNDTRKLTDQLGF